jgi:hypothetical protein
MFWIQDVFDTSFRLIGHMLNPPGTQVQTRQLLSAR